MSRRSQLLLLLVVSGLLHAALLFALWRSPSADVRRREPAQAVELEIVTRDARPAPPVPEEAPRPARSAERERRKDEAPKPLAQRERKKDEAPAASGEAAPEPLATAPDERPPPPARDVPLQLEPPGLLGGGLLKGPPSTGRTLRNVPGSEPDPKALAAREAEEARQKVDGWAHDATASARATGATPPYFAKLRQGFSEKLVDPPPPDTDVLARRLKREQLEAIERFGKTGTPFAPQARDVRRETSDRLRAAVEAGRAANVYMMDVTTPILALVAIVEVRQARDGSLIDLQVLEGSGDPKFDRWAVSHLRDALASAAPPTDGGVGIHEDGMRTRWRLEEYLGNPRVRVHLISIY
ncbi:MULTISPECIES: ferrichrome ABC transporter substrate-binding protein [unclassified Corallococcus]|uniref:ferrichrome ABC transporter substrate-binding protein n=1 Tax=unclassified Corallococcus TaxID=2685029 RepID=UPI001A8ED461|nr:ferrichrome ABC transporter substrate-binding protein [Corallococcus sp. NCRR]MBN9682650.1 ferrichrome ABC transporter substrate-binding protein [Corallococcus sp. NCSPR001]WAS85805.1 ferrichrome ABC transporter substrate-binding protein [Corallococcus sp. NCRR]